MSASRDEYTRVVFTQCEASPRPVAAVEILRDYDETVRRGMYYGDVAVITMAAEFLYKAGVALHGVTHLTPSQVGMDMEASFREGLSVFVVCPHMQEGASIHVIEQLSPRDVETLSILRRRVLLSLRVVEWLGLQPFVRSVVHGRYAGLDDRISAE